MSGHAVAVLVVTPQGIILVRDPKKPAPVFWKLPGGKSESGETALMAAIREIKEETGVNLEGVGLVVLYFQNRTTHDMTIYGAHLEALPETLKKKGDEDEDVAVFAPAEILTMMDFFPPHRKAVEKTLHSFA